MGAPAIYHIPNRRRSGCSAVINNATNTSNTGVNGLDRRILNYDKYLKANEETNSSSTPSMSLGSSLFGRPFGAVNLPSTRWNPFARKSRGILGVIKAQAKRNRVVSKHGRINVYRKTEDNENQHRYLKDFFTSMIDLAWSWTLLWFCAAFYLSWLIFSAVWFLIALAHGDLDPRDPDHKVCVENVKDFTSAFLFSLETQHTIGYGVRVPTEQCPAAVIAMSCQCIVGVIIQACMAGIVFAKFTKPTNRAETILFSTNALITMRNGSYYLSCRIGDMRPTHLLESHVSGVLLRRATTDEGEEIPYHLVSMDFGVEMDGSQDFFQMFWPVVVSHKIDEKSPLYSMSARDIGEHTFEIILTMEGITPETGNTVQVRTSFLPNEILWGYRFDHSCVSYDKVMAKYVVSMSNLNKMTPDNTPRISPKAFEEKIAQEATQPKVSVSQADDEDQEEELGGETPGPGNTVITSQLLGVL